MIQPIYIGEDNLFRWDRAKHASDGSYVNAGTGSWDLRTADDPALGTSVASGTLTYVTASNGRWQGTMDKDAPSPALVEGTTYYLFLTLNDGAGADGYRRIECPAQYQAEE